MKIRPWLGLKVEIALSKVDNSKVSVHTHRRTFFKKLLVLNEELSGELDITQAGPVSFPSLFFAVLLETEYVMDRNHFLK